MKTIIDNEKSHIEAGENEPTNLGWYRFMTILTENLFPLPYQYPNNIRDISRKTLYLPPKSLLMIRWSLIPNTYE